MIGKLDLPDGEWAMVRDPAKVPERLRRPVAIASTGLFADIKAARAMAEADTTDLEEMAETLDGDLFNRLQALNDLVIVALVSEWSVDLAISVESVGELPADAYDILRRETAKHVAALMPDFSPNPDPSSPTGP